MGLDDYSLYTNISLLTEIIDNLSQIVLHRVGQLHTLKYLTLVFSLEHSEALISRRNATLHDIEYSRGRFLGLTCQSKLTV